MLYISPEISYGDDEVQCGGVVLVPGQVVAVRQDLEKGNIFNIIESLIPIRKSIGQLFFAPDGWETNCFRAFFTFTSGGGNYFFMLRSRPQPNEPS